MRMAWIDRAFAVFLLVSVGAVAVAWKDWLTALIVAGGLSFLIVAWLQED